LDVSNWDTSSVTDMGDMFQNCVDLSWLDVSNWDTSSVTDMWYMFYGCSKLTKLDVSNWDTSNVTNMDAMFYKCSNLTELDLTNRKTNKVTNMSFMFNSNTNLKTIYASTWFVTTKVTSDTGWDYLFYGDTKLVWWNRTEYSSSHTDKEYARIDQPWTPWYFTLKQ
jgi:surface protein